MKKKSSAAKKKQVASVEAARQRVKAAKQQVKSLKARLKQARAALKAAKAERAEVETAAKKRADSAGGRTPRSGTGARKKAAAKPAVKRVARKTRKVRPAVEVLAVDAPLDVPELAHSTAPASLLHPPHVDGN